MLNPELSQALQSLFQGRCSTNDSIIEQHSHDESWHAPQRPDAVVFPQNNEEVAKTLQLCLQHQTPVVAYGTGTGVEGHVIPLQGGICLDLSQMKQILSINQADQDARVQAGVTRKQLNHELRHDGLFFSVDPGADASLGGMAATRASGTNTVRYGTMADNILGLTVVLANGEIIQTGSRAKKSATGYNLTQLFTGSEGTLGIITEVSVKLHPIPEQMSSASVAFGSVKQAVDAVICIIQSGIGVARIEFLDAAQMAACNRFSQLNKPEKPTLFLEFHGSANSVKEDAERCKEITENFAADSYLWASDQQTRNQLWQARHDALYAAKALRPGCEVWTTDVCVPISKLADCIESTRKDIEAAGLCATMVGHVGDGNFHVLMVLNRDDPHEVALAESVNKKMIERALAMDGSCSGEHGIGIGKLPYLLQQHGPSYQYMNQIKQLFDPHKILNPGKLGDLPS